MLPSSGTWGGAVCRALYPTDERPGPKSTP
jgi:hypothetical protein